MGVRYLYCGAWSFKTPVSGVASFALTDEWILTGHSVTDRQGTARTHSVQVSPDGRTLYSTNRGQNNIAVWRTLESGLLDLAGHYDCGGDGPRGLHISPDGETLFCANNGSGTVTVLRLDKVTGAPVDVIQTLNVPCAACVRSVELK